MTSTNDGKDVKSNQLAGPKAKTYYIELYKTLEAQLSAESELDSRTHHLCEAWRRVHCLCAHSAPTTHPHLISWLQRHTTQTLLQSEWQKKLDNQEQLQCAIDSFIAECDPAAEGRAGRPQWETVLLKRAEWFKTVIPDPWGNPVLKALLGLSDPTSEGGDGPTDEQVLQWLKEERAVFFVTRLRQLGTSKGNELAKLALKLASAVMDRVRSCRPPVSDTDQPIVISNDKDGPPTFHSILSKEAGFTDDIWELITDIEFVLLYKDRSKCIALAKQTPLHMGFQLMERLNSRLEVSPREKRLWKNSKDVATLISQVMLARCMVVPSCSGVIRTTLVACSGFLVRVLPDERLPASMAALAAPAASSRHLHALAVGVHTQCKNEHRPFVCELYIRAITAGMNELERLKVNKDKDTEARAAEKLLSTWFIQLGSLLGQSARLAYECALTAFSVHPSRVMYDRISAAPQLPHQALASHPHHPANTDAQEPATETNSEFGSWATDSRSQTNLVKTSETLNLKKTQQQSNVLSTAVLNEGEALGLSPELCQDLIVLLSGPRVKTLSWDMDKEVLIENCRSYMERTHGGTKALTTELKYLNLDPGSFQHLPEEEDEDEGDIYYGIEKGYEHLVEVPDPDDIWEDALSDPDKTESCYSNDDEAFITIPRRKKKPKRPSHTSDEGELDPLSYLVSKPRPRPHSSEKSKGKTERSKDRSKDAKKKDTQEKKHKKERSTSRRKKKEKRNDTAEPVLLDGDPLRLDNDPLTVDDNTLQSAVVNGITPQSHANEENNIQPVPIEDKSKAKPKKERKKREKKEKKEKAIPKKKGTMSGALRRLIGQKIVRVHPNTQEYIRREETETDFNNQMFITDSDYDSQGKSSVASGNDPDVLFDGLYSMDEIKSPERVNPTKPDVLNTLNITKQLNTPVRQKINNARCIQNLLKDRQQPRPVTTIATVTTSTPPPLIYTRNEASDDVKVNTINGIKRLLEFRKQKSTSDLLNERQHATHPAQYGQNNPAYKTIPNKVITSNMVEQVPHIQAGCQKAVSVPNIPKIFINKQQIDQINVLKNEVNSYYLNRNNNENNWRTNSIKSQPVTPEMLNNQLSNLDWSKSIKADGNKVDQKVFNSFHQSGPVKVAGSITSKLATQSNFKMNQNISKQNIPKQNVASGEQNNLHDFLKDLHRSINAGVSKDNVGINTPTTDNNISYPINYSAKQTKPQKKAESAPNTFARLNYMHRNRQGEAVMNNELKPQNKFHRSSHSQFTEDRNVLNFQNDTILFRDTTIARKTEKTAQKKVNTLNDQHSTGVSIIHQTVIRPTSNEKRSILTPQNQATPRTTMLTDDDQNQLLLLLRQQGKLNMSKAPINHEVTATKGPNVKLTPSHSMSNMTAALNLQNPSPGNVDYIYNQTQVRRGLSILPTQSCQNVSHSIENTAKFQPRSGIKKIPEKPKNTSTQHKIITGNTKDFKNNVKGEPQDWESVMDALLAHKTPSRSSNALTMTGQKDQQQKSVQDKSNNLREQQLKNVDSNIPIHRSAVNLNVNSSSINNRQITNTKGVKFNQSKLKHNTEKPVISKTDDVQSLIINRATTSYPTSTNNPQVPLQTAANEMRKNSQTVIKRVTKTQAPLETFQKEANCEVPQVDVDPLLSDILPSADYDLLEELMDDDLRQEIGELLSDEDAFSVTNDIPKASKVKTDIKPLTNDESIQNMNVRHNRLLTKQPISVSQSVTKTPEPEVAQGPTSFNNAKIITNKSVLKTSHMHDQKTGHVSATTEKTTVSNVNHIKPHPVIVSTNVQSNPTQQFIRNNVIDDQTHFMTLDSTMATNLLHTPSYVQQNIVSCGNQNVINNLRPMMTANQATGNVYTTVTHQPLQKVVLIRPEIVYDQYSTVQVHQVPQSVNPAICNFNSSSFVAVPNISIYGAQITAPVITPLIISTPVTLPSNENVTPPVTSNQNNYKNVAPNVTPQHGIFPSKTVGLEKSSNCTKCSEKINPDPITVQKTTTATRIVQPNSFNEQNTMAIDVVNSNSKTDNIKISAVPGNNSERKVLSEVQENQSQNIHTKPLLINQEVKKDVHKSREERIRRKKLTLLNRQNHIVSNSKPIPLTYAPIAKVIQNNEKRVDCVITETTKKQTVIALGYKPITDDRNVSDLLSKNNDKITIDEKGNCRTKQHQTEPEVNHKCETNEGFTVTLRSSKQPIYIKEKSSNSDVLQPDNFLVKEQTGDGTVKSQRLESLKVNKKGDACFMQKISNTEVNCVQSIDEHSSSSTLPTYLSKNSVKITETNLVTLRSFNKPVTDSVSSPQALIEKNISSEQPKECGNQLDIMDCSKENNNIERATIKQLLNNQQTTDKIVSSKNKKPKKRVAKGKANNSAPIPDKIHHETGEGLTEKNMQEKQKNDETNKNTKPSEVNGSQNLPENISPVMNVNLDVGQLPVAIKAQNDPKTLDEPKNAKRQVDILNDNTENNITSENGKFIKTRAVSTRSSILNNNIANREIDSVFGKTSAPKDITKLASNKQDTIENQTENTNANKASELDITKPSGGKIPNHFTNNMNESISNKEESVKCNKLTTLNNDCETVSKTDEVEAIKQSKDRVTPHVKDISKTSRKHRRKLKEEECRQEKLINDLKDIITIKELPRKENDDPFKRCISIKISNGNCFKATVSGKLQVDIDSLFKDPGLRSVLLNNLPGNASCFINVQQKGSSISSDNIRTQIIYPQNKNIETVNLISDDEDEEVTKKPQVFRTEFGTFNVQPLNDDILSKHQDKFSQKCSVLINKCQKPVITRKTEPEQDNCDEKPYIIDEFAKSRLLSEVSLPQPIVVSDEKNKDIIEIDDSSNDSIGISTYNKIVTKNTFVVTELKLPESIQMDLKQLKETLLQDLCVDIGDNEQNIVPKEVSNICGELKDVICKKMDRSENRGDSLRKNYKPLIKSARNRKRGIKHKRLLSSRNKHPKKCRQNKVKCDELVKKYQLLNITKKCYVSLERCDKILKTITGNRSSGTVIETNENYSTASYNVQSFAEENESPQSNLKRSGSISILNEFEHTDQEEVAKTTICKNYKESRICQSEWYMTKLELQYLSKLTEVNPDGVPDDVSTDCESDLDNSLGEVFFEESTKGSVSNIVQVPSLFKLSFKSIENSNILKSLEYPEVKTCCISKPDLKRKSSTAEDTVNTKISKLDYLTISSENDYTLKYTEVEKGSEVKLSDEPRSEKLSKQISKAEVQHTDLEISMEIDTNTVKELNKNHLVELQQDILSEIVSEQQQNFVSQVLITDTIAAQEDAESVKEPKPKPDLVAKKQDSEAVLGNLPLGGEISDVDKDTFKEVEYVARTVSESRSKNDEQDLIISVQEYFDPELNAANARRRYVDCVTDKGLENKNDSIVIQQNNPSEIVEKVILDNEITAIDVNALKEIDNEDNKTQFKNDDAFPMQDIQSEIVSELVPIDDRVNESYVNTLNYDDSGGDKKSEIKNDLVVSQDTHNEIILDRVLLDDGVHEIDISSKKEDHCVEEKELEFIDVDHEINENVFETLPDVNPLEEVDLGAEKRSEDKNDLLTVQQHIQIASVAEQVHLDLEINKMYVNTMNEVESGTDNCSEIKNDIFVVPQDKQSEIVVEHLDPEINKTVVNTIKEVDSETDKGSEIKNELLVVQHDNLSENCAEQMHLDMEEITTDLDSGAEKESKINNDQLNVQPGVQNGVVIEQIHVDNEVNKTGLNTLKVLDSEAEKQSEINNYQINEQQNIQNVVVSDPMCVDDEVNETYVDTKNEVESGQEKRSEDILILQTAIESEIVAEYVQMGDELDKNDVGNLKKFDSIPDAISDSKNGSNAIQNLESEDGAMHVDNERNEIDFDKSKDVDFGGDIISDIKYFSCVVQHIQNEITPDQVHVDDRVNETDINTSKEVDLNMIVSEQIYFNDGIHDCTAKQLDTKEIKSTEDKELKSENNLCDTKQTIQSEIFTEQVHSDDELIGNNDTEIKEISMVNKDSGNKNNLLDIQPEIHYEIVSNVSDNQVDVPEVETIGGKTAIEKELESENNLYDIQSEISKQNHSDNEVLKTKSDVFDADKDIQNDSNSEKQHVNNKINLIELDTLKGDLAVRRESEKKHNVINEIGSCIHNDNGLEQMPKDVEIQKVDAGTFSMADLKVEEATNVKYGLSDDQEDTLKSSEQLQSYVEIKVGDIDELNGKHTGTDKDSKIQGIINDTQHISEIVEESLCSNDVQIIEMEKLKEGNNERKLKIRKDVEIKVEVNDEPISDEKLFDEKCEAKEMSPIRMEIETEFVDQKSVIEKEISHVKQAETPALKNSNTDLEKQSDIVNSQVTDFDLYTHYNTKQPENKDTLRRQTFLEANNTFKSHLGKVIKGKQERTNALKNSSEAEQKEENDNSPEINICKMQSNNTLNTNIDNSYSNDSNFIKNIAQSDRDAINREKSNLEMACSKDKDVEFLTNVTKDASNDVNKYCTDNKTNGTPKNITLLYEGDSKVVLKGSIIEDAIVGTCYVFPIPISPHSLNSVMPSKDHSQNDTKQNNCFETEQALSPVKGTKLVEDVDLIVIKPEVTYTRTNFMPPRRCLKRKIESIDSKIHQKKYRKGKNIDYPKITVAAMCDFAYSKEFKRLSNYCSSIKFSYTKDYHLTRYGDVHTMLEDWPIKEIQTQSPKVLDHDCNLFMDKELRSSSDPTRKTLAEELSASHDDKAMSSEEIKETNFSMGFGEGSGRVNQNFKDRSKIISSMAATLSDVKQFQPFLSENKTNVQETLASKLDQLQKIDKFYSYFKLRDKVRMFFEETTARLNYSLMHNNFKGGKEKLGTNNFFSTMEDSVYHIDFFQPSVDETVVQVVQVGQLPVSAAAQNPVTCDPRVTQVTDASLPQCSMEDGSPEDMEIKTEYTELTTAEISLPLSLPEYEHHQTLIAAPQVSNLPNGNENITIETEVKIEVLDEVPENADESSCYDTKDFETFSSDQINNSEYPAFDANEMNVQIKTEPDLKIILEPSDNNLDEEQITDLYQHQHHPNGSVEKQDQLAHAMNAAGITNSPEPDSEPTSEAIDLSSAVTHNMCEGTDESQFQESSMTTMALQQALSKILPQHLNTTIEPENSVSGGSSQFLHIVHGKNTSVNQSSSAENLQEAANTPPTPIFHIVQNKSSPTSSTPNDSAANSNSYNNLSLADTGLSQAGNQLLHIVNAAAPKSNNASQLLKRVNLLTNLTNTQGSNEQKMVQFVCKSADAKGIQLNAQQRGMVLRLHPIENTAQTTPSKPNGQEVANEKSPDTDADGPQVELKSRSMYEENYAKFIQESNKQTAESVTSANTILESTMLPKFHQVFGKSIYAENNQNNNIGNNSNGHFENTQRMANPLLLRKPSCPTSQAPQPVAQQVKQTITPMNIQTMHGGVIYTRQIPVNIGGGQTINLITVPSTERVDETVQKQKPDEKYVPRGEVEQQSFIKIVPQTPSTSNAEVTTDESNTSGVSNENSQNSQPPPMLTQMRIKLPMLSKNTQMVSGTRVVRPSFFQIQRNVIGGANQPVYQQLVLTAAPTLGAHSIRLPQMQTNREMKVGSANQTSSESEMSSSNLELREQLREFDMVLEQVKERSEVQPNGTPAHEYNVPPGETPETSENATSTTSSETTQQILYSVGNNQQLNVAYVNRKQTVVSTPATTSFARSPDSSGIVDSPPSSSHAPQTLRPLPSETPSETSPPQSQNKPSKSSSKSKSRPKSHHTQFKFNHVPPKPSNQKPMEDEQTTQRILYILAEYKEQVENSPDKDKPAPRRRTNLTAGGIVAAPSTGGSKRKKSGSRRSGRDSSPIDDNCRTMGSEDSSCGTSQGDCNESCLETPSPQDSPRKVAKKLNYDQEPPATQSRPQAPRNVLVTDGPTIAVTRATPGKPATAVLMPANYILPVSMVKSGQQIAIVTNRGPKILTVGGGEGGATNALLLQRLIGPAGLKPMLARPGVRHVRLPTAALQNLQAFNLNLAASAPPPTPSETPAPMPSPPQLIPTNSKAPPSPWPTPEQEEVKPERESSPEETEQEPGPWNVPQDYSYEETVRTEMDRTVLDAIPDRYSPDMEAERMFDKMFDVDSKKDYIVESQADSPRCPYDIDTSDCDDKAFHQVVQRRDGITNRHRLMSAATLRQKFALMEDELRLQKSLSEECADLGVDSPSASDLFPEAELLFSSSPAHEVSTSHQPHTPQPVILSQSSNISPPELEDHSATDRLISPAEGRGPPPEERRTEEIDLGLEGVGIVTVSEDGMRATISLDHEEFVRSHPNTTFHREPTDDGEIQAVTIDDLKARHLTSTIFQADGAPATVLVSAPNTTVISQATPDGSGVDHLRCSHADTLHALRTDADLRLPSFLDEPPALNTAHVIRRLRPDSRYDDPAGANSDSRGTMDSSGDGDRSSPERNAELFWEMHSRSLTERRLDFSSDSDKCSPSDENNSTDSSGMSHVRLDSVIKNARGFDVDDGSVPPLRTYPPKRVHHDHRKDDRYHDESRRRASNRGVVKRGCHCCNGSPAPPKPKKSRPRKPNLDFN